MIHGAFRTVIIRFKIPNNMKRKRFKKKGFMETKPACKLDECFKWKYTY